MEGDCEDVLFDAEEACGAIHVQFVSKRKMKVPISIEPF